MVGHPATLTSEDNLLTSKQGGSNQAYPGDSLLGGVPAYTLGYPAHLQPTNINPDKSWLHPPTNWNGDEINTVPHHSDQPLNYQGSFNPQSLPAMGANYPQTYAAHQQDLPQQSVSAGNTHYPNGQDDGWVQSGTILSPQRENYQNSHFDNGANWYNYQ